MARPKKYNAEFFSHDCDMRNDIKIRNIRRHFKHEGYSLWIMILEHLGNCDYFEYEWTEENIELLEPDFDMDADRIKEIVDRMIHLGLLQNEYGMLTCNKFSERLFQSLTPKRDSFLIENSIRYKRSGVNVDGNSIKGDDNPHSRVKDSKGEDSGEQNRGVHESVLPNSTGQHTTPKESLENSSDNQLGVEGSPLEGEPIPPIISSSVDLYNAVFEGFKS